MHRKLIASVTVLAASLALVQPAPAAPADEPVAAAARKAKLKPRTVKLKDSYFSPSSISAKKKAKLRFVWAGRLVHNLVGRRIPRKYARAKRRHRRVTRTYGRGVYRFSCTIHPGMDFKLRVR